MPPKKTNPSSTDPSNSSSTPVKINADDFYGEYYGQRIEDLETIDRTFHSTRPFIFLAGDSSLDSKYWLPPRPRRKAVNGYETILTPALCAPDVAYSINAVLADLYREEESQTSTISHKTRTKTKQSDPLPPLSSYLCVNGAVEESTVAARYNGQLLPQDEFIRDHMQSNDILIVSVGGNDIALKATVSTMVSMAALLLSSADSVNKGTAYGFGHFLQMFRDDTQQYINNLCSKTKPRCVILCTIYYPHQLAGGSWADFSLSALRYNSNPEILQRAIRSVFTYGTSKVQIPGTQVIPCPLFEVLDPSENSNDYIQRVEPSEQGAMKMANRFIELLQERMGNTENTEVRVEKSNEGSVSTSSSTGTTTRKIRTRSSTSSSE